MYPSMYCHVDPSTINITGLNGTYTNTGIANDSQMDRKDADIYQRDLVTHVLSIAGMVICVLGIIGNSLSQVVLTRKTMRSSTYSYLSALSVCDTLVLLCTIFLLSKDTVRPVLGSVSCKPLLYINLFPYIHPLAFTLQVNSVWLTLAFTVDRYIMICHPFKGEELCTVGRARKVVTCLVISAFIINVPKWWEYEAIPMFHDYWITTFGRTRTFKLLYHSWFYIFFVCGVPFLALAVLNAFLMRAVQLSQRKGREMNAAEKKRNDTTIMLISVIIVFFICQMPALASRIYYAIIYESENTWGAFVPYTLGELSNLLVVLNSAINILPYYFFGRRFRRIFWDLFCKCLLENRYFRRLSRGSSLSAANRDVDIKMAAVEGAAEGDMQQPCDHARKLTDASACTIPKENHLNLNNGSDHSVNIVRDAFICHTTNNEDILGDAYISTDVSNNDATDMLLEKNPRENGTKILLT